jgi:hypothetical protein
MNIRKGMSAVTGKIGDIIEKENSTLIIIWLAHHDRNTGLLSQTKARLKVLFIGNNPYKKGDWFGAEGRWVPDLATEKTTPIFMCDSRDIFVPSDWR